VQGPSTCSGAVALQMGIGKSAAQADWLGPKTSSCLALFYIHHMVVFHNLAEPW